jgi:predicted nuclease of restriction endonuclease-like (RecB) superfamily
VEPEKLINDHSNFCYRDGLSQRGNEVKTSKEQTHIDEKAKNGAVNGQAHLYFLGLKLAPNDLRGS